MAKANDSGQTLVEAALSLSLFLLLVFGVMDLGFMFSSKLTLQNAVRQAGRYAITGQCVTASDGSCAVSRYNSIIETVQNYSVGLLNGSNLGDISVTCTDEGGGCPNQAGGPGDVVTITVTYPYNFVTPFMAKFFPSHKYTIKVSSAFTNENFSPDQS